MAVEFFQIVGQSGGDLVLDFDLADDSGGLGGELTVVLREFRGC
jgi:hypothetical protein